MVQIYYFFTNSTLKKAKILDKEVGNILTLQFDLNFTTNRSQLMKQKLKNFSIVNARVTSTISVALVLLILGIVAITGIAADNITRDIKENLGFDIELKEDLDEETVASLKNEIENKGFASSVTLFTPEQAMRQWEEATGENIIEVVGVNPFSAEIEVKLKAEYATPETIEEIASVYRSNPIVEEVSMHAEMIEKINRNMHTAMIVMAVIAAALLLISFVLINNTIRLTVYSRRFIIHTMKLVGATAGFIRRPFIKSNVINGLIAGIVAAVILAGLRLYASTIDSATETAIPTTEAAVVYVAMPLVGMVICAIAALFAANRYLKVDYDDMFD